MKIDNWSKEYQGKLQKVAKRLEALGAEELAMRIAVCLYTQDSCGDCATQTISMTLMTGQSGLWTCGRCTKELEGIGREE